MACFFVLASSMKLETDAKEDFGFGVDFHIPTLRTWLSLSLIGEGFVGVIGFREGVTTIVVAFQSLSFGVTRLIASCAVAVL